MRHPDPAAVKRDFDARMMQVDNALQFVREQAKQFNDKLPHLVRPEVTKQQAVLQRNSNFTLGYAKTPDPAPPVASPAWPIPAAREKFDVFLSHASEDTAAIARPLYEALRIESVTVWFAEAVLTMGDSLSGKIDEGLARCPHGIVIISPSFLAKRWPQKELAGLVAREVIGGKKVILPIWHDIDEVTLVQHSPTLADKVAGRSPDGIPALVKMILDVIR
ncbi:MAG TPA: toll/interleukin-1 receptor domain-containing protein [Bryobacteraceae bacterium]